MKSIVFCLSTASLCATLHGQLSYVDSYSGYSSSFTSATSADGKSILSYYYNGSSGTTTSGPDIGSNPDPANCTLGSSHVSVSTTIQAAGTAVLHYFDGKTPDQSFPVYRSVTVIHTTDTHSWTCSTPPPPPTPEPSTYASIFGIALIGFGGYRKWAGRK